MHQIDRPIVGDFPRQRNTSAAIGCVVIIVLNKGVVVDRLTGRRAVKAAVTICHDGGCRCLARLDSAHHEQRIACRQLASDAHIAVERHLESACDIVDIATLTVGIKHSANGKLVLNYRNVDERVASNAFFTTLSKGVAGVEAGAKRARVWFVRDVADRAAHRTCTKERALWTCQHFDALKVNCVKVKVTANKRCRRIVNVQSNRRLRTSGTCDLQTGRVCRQTTDEDGRCAWTARSRADIRKILDQLIEFSDVQLVQRFTAQGRDSKRHPVDRLFATRCCHNNISDSAILFFRCLLRKCRIYADANTGRRDDHRSCRNF